MSVESWIGNAGGSVVPQLLKKHEFTFLRRQVNYNVISKVQGSSIFVRYVFGRGAVMSEVMIPWYIFVHTILVIRRLARKHLIPKFLRNLMGTFILCSRNIMRIGKNTKSFNFKAQKTRNREVNMRTPVSMRHIKGL